jgi:hypothetical protein
MTVLVLAAGGLQTSQIPYALTQWLGTRLRGAHPPEFIRIPPVLDMLGVRYVLFRGPIPSRLDPQVRGDDTWVLTNPSAMPRAFVPRRVETVADKQQRVERLADDQFNPREVAFVETSVDLPAACRGSAKIVDEIPTRVTLALHMETAGLVVLADRWDAGWQAYLDGQPAPILCTNHAIRGVVVGADAQTLEFRYEPASVAWGNRLAALSLAMLVPPSDYGLRTVAAGGCRGVRSDGPVPAGQLRRRPIHL